MDIILKKEEVAFYFNQARLNIMGLDEAIEKQLQHVGSNKESAKKRKGSSYSIYLKPFTNYKWYNIILFCAMAKQKGLKWINCLH